MPLRVLGPQQKRRTLEISSLSRIWRRKFCDVAQLVEHLTLTQKVVGSKPAITTMESKRLTTLMAIAKTINQKI